MRKIIFRIVAGTILVLEAIFIGIIAKAMINGRLMMHLEGVIIFTLVICIPLMISAVLSILSIDQVKKRHQVAKGFAIFIGFIYVMILVNILFLNDRDHSGRTSISIIHNLRYNSNFIPFYTIGCYIIAWIKATVNQSTILINIVGNSLIFAPMGMLLPSLFIKQRKIKTFLITMLIMLICAECIQIIFGVGSCDIDDIILNMTGAYIFYKIWKLKSCQRILSKCYLIE